MIEHVVEDETSVIWQIFIRDSASTVGNGKTGLVYNSAGLVAYYKRSSATGSTEITLVNIGTLGTFASGGFKEIDATNMPGFYEFHPPNACFSSGARNVSICLKGASGMVQVEIIGQIVKFNLQATSPNVNVNNWKGTAAPDNTGDAFVRIGANGA